MGNNIFPSTLAFWLSVFSSCSPPTFGSVLHTVLCKKMLHADPGGGSTAYIYGKPFKLGCKKAAEQVS